MKTSSRTKRSAAAGEILARPYRKELIQNADGTWFAHIVEFAGCMTEGDTPADAIANLDEAMALWVEVGLENGDPIPPPSSDDQYSGKFLMRVPKPLHRELALCAQAEGVSLNQYVLSKLAGAMQRPGVSYLVKPRPKK